MSEIQFDVADKFLSDDCTALYCNAEKEIRFLNVSAGAGTSHVLFWKEMMLTIVFNPGAYAILDRFHGGTVNSIPK
jgi:hypothetical protein